ncbi:MAG: hypothetical protein ACREMY_17710 [bacterium]
MVGIDRSTIEKWIRLGRVKAPPVTFQGKRRVRCWDKEGLVQLRKLKQSWDFERSFWKMAHELLQADKDQRKKKQQEKKQKAD